MVVAALAVVTGGSSSLDSVKACVHGHLCLSRRPKAKEEEHILYASRVSPTHAAQSGNVVLFFSRSEETESASNKQWKTLQRKASGDEKYFVPTHTRGTSLRPIPLRYRLLPPLAVITSLKTFHITGGNVAAIYGQTYY